MIFKFDEVTKSNFKFGDVPDLLLKSGKCRHLTH